MKQFKNVVVVALAVILVGCSEETKNEVVVNNPIIPESPSDNNAIHRAAQDASILRATFANGAGEAWDENDDLNVYTLESMKHNSYQLSEGAGTGNAIFTLTDGTEKFEKGTLYALTASKYIYGFSATMNGNSKVTVTIPCQYEIDEVGAQEGTSRMPVPCWGIASFGTDGKLEATFQSMTALLKIDTTTLPEGTHAVVLTTKNVGYLGTEALESGEGEALSGTFDSELTAGAKLANSPIFVSYDTLRVNLFNDDIDDMDENPVIRYRHVYIPVIARSYAKLHVLAITGDSDGRLVRHDRPRHWEGKVLKTFNASTSFSPNTIVNVEPQSTAIHTPRI